MTSMLATFGWLCAAHAMTGLLALLLLVAAWSVNASWGPDFFKSTLMFKVGATAPVAP